MGTGAEGLWHVLCSEAGQEASTLFAALELLSIAVSLTSLALAACIALRPLERERSRSVWCEPRQRHTTVKLVEHRQFGMVRRSVLDCPLRSPGERCNEMCICPARTKRNIQAHA